MRGHGILRNTKIIKTECLPRFVQGVDLQCNKCNGFCTSYEQSYVDTFPIWRMKELDAVIAEKADGIDMALIVRMRNGTSAAEVSGSACTNLRRWYASKHEKWKASREQLRIHNVRVIDEEYPPFPEHWVPKPPQLINDLIWDYLSNKDGLLREMAALKSTTAIAVYHQSKVVKSIKKGAEGELNKR